MVFESPVVEQGHSSFDPLLITEISSRDRRSGRFEGRSLMRAVLLGLPLVIPSRQARVMRAPDRHTRNRHEFNISFNEYRSRVAKNMV